MTMGPQTQKLIVILREIIALLESDGDSHWANWMRISKTRLEAGDFSGITHLLNAYGGMGSFNDLIICQRFENGKFSWTDGYKEKNALLSDLRSKAWELADAIRRNQEKIGRTTA
jgi:hypothetical protein